MSSISFFPSGNSQKRWREHMEHNYISGDDILPCVFHVPDKLRETKPDAYVPQVVGLGPYHHFRPEVQFMGSKKRAAVKDYLKVVEFENFIHLVRENPQKFEHVMRSCYDRYLDLDKRTMSWIAIVDGIFLLHFIQEKTPDMYSNLNLEKLVADVLMLENQIPIVLLLEVRKVLRLQFNVSTASVVSNQICQFCRKHSPLELTNDAVQITRAFKKSNHMLHVMYQLIMKNKATIDDQQGQPVQSQSQPLVSTDDDDDDDDDEESEEEDHISEIKAEENKGGSKSQGDETDKRFRSQVEIITDFGREILRHAIEEFNSALAHAQNAGLKVPGNISQISQILRNLERTFQLQHHKEALLADKIEIPSVSRLIAILDIKFRRLDKGHGIGNIALDPDKNEFRLPVIKLGPNSEVILRNLVAYEATASTEQLAGVGPTKLRDYVDLMCGLIKTDKDVQHLRGAKIIQGSLPDQEIVKMCNGIKKSEEKPHEESKVHSSVKNANDKYDKTWVVKSFRWAMKKAASANVVLERIFPIMVTVLLGIQTVCEIFGCRGRPNGLGTSFQNIYSDSDSEAKLMLPRKVLRYF